jgi:hypothetical protein
VSKILHSFGVISMVSIAKELEAAQAAKAAVNTISIRTSKTSISTALRRANLAAIENLGKGGALNEARVNVGIAISNLSMDHQR